MRPNARVCLFLFVSVSIDFFFFFFSAPILEIRLLACHLGSFLFFSFLFCLLFLFVQKK
jgi:hypothetical protein